MCDADASMQVKLCDDDRLGFLLIDYNDAINTDRPACGLWSTTFSKVNSL